MKIIIETTPKGCKWIKEMVEGYELNNQFDKDDNLIDKNEELNSSKILHNNVKTTLSIDIVLEPKDKAKKIPKSDNWMIEFFESYILSKSKIPDIDFKKLKWFDEFSELPKDIFDKDGIDMSGVLKDSNTELNDEKQTINTYRCFSEKSNSEIFIKADYFYIEDLTGRLNFRIQDQVVALLSSDFSVILEPQKKRD